MLHEQNCNTRGDVTSQTGGKEENGDSVFAARKDSGDRKD